LRVIFGSKSGILGCRRIIFSSLRELLKLSLVFVQGIGLSSDVPKSYYRSASTNDSNNCQDDSANHHYPIFVWLDRYFGDGNDTNWLVLILSCIPGGFFLAVCAGLARG